MIPSAVVSAPLSFFPATTLSTHALRAKISSFCLLDQFYTSMPVHAGTERNKSLFLSFHLLELKDVFWSVPMSTQPLSVLLFWTERYGSEWLRFRVNGDLENLDIINKYTFCNRLGQDVRWWKLIHVRLIVHVWIHVTLIDVTAMDQVCWIMLAMTRCYFHYSVVGCTCLCMDVRNEALLRFH